MNLTSAFDKELDKLNYWNSSDYSKWLLLLYFTKKNNSFCYNLHLSYIFNILALILLWFDRSVFHALCSFSIIVCIFVFRSLTIRYLYAFIFQYLLNAGESRKRRRIESYKSKRLQSQDDDEKKNLFCSQIYFSSRSLLFI